MIWTQLYIVLIKQYLPLKKSSSKKVTNYHHIDYFDIKYTLTSFSDES
jgi:hypothetical protein